MTASNSTGASAPAPTRVSAERRAYIEDMFRDHPDAARGVPEDELTLVASAHCLSAGDFERAIDFAASARPRRDRRTR